MSQIRDIVSCSHHSPRNTFVNLLHCVTLIKFIDADINAGAAPEPDIHWGQQGCRRLKQWRRAPQERWRRH
jgi:hypothetical protein